MDKVNVGASSGRAGLKREEIAADLRRAIVSGSYSNGMLLPGENELAQKYAVSRGTIRRALDGLVDDHLINTRTGVGSFVTFDGHQLREASSWGKALMLSGVDIEPKTLRMELVVDPELAASVGSREMRFLALDRVRHVADGHAVSIERSRVPAVGAVALAPTAGLVNGSLAATMEASGLLARSGEQWISVAPLDEADALLLGRTVGDLFLHSIRIARDRDGRFVEKVVSWLDPNRFRLHMAFGG